MARPKTDKYNVETMTEIMQKYIDITELPILKEVCYKNHWNYDYTMELARGDEEFSRTIKELINKKEVALERGGISSKYNSTMAIFSLKQLGWKDKQDTEESDTTSAPTININITDNSNLEKKMYEVK